MPDPMLSLPMTNTSPISPINPGTPKPVSPIMSKILLYTFIGLTIIGAVCGWSYFNKYKSTQIILDQKTTSLTTIQSQLIEVQKEYSDYQKQTEANTSWTKKPYIYKGKLLTDDKGNPVYTISYSKKSSSTSSGTSSGTSNISQSTTITQAVTVTVHETVYKQEGQKTNGEVYVSAPSDIFTGKLTGLGVGGNHNFILGTSLGLEIGRNNITNFNDIFNTLPYVNLHIGYQIQ